MRWELLGHYEFFNSYPSCSKPSIDAMKWLTEFVLPKLRHMSSLVAADGDVLLGVPEAGCPFKSQLEPQVPDISP